MPQEKNREAGGRNASDRSWDTALPDSVREDAAHAAAQAKRKGAAAIDQIKEGARSLGGEAKERVSRLAEDQKESVTEHLDAFAQAIKRAGEDLSERDQTMAAQVVRQAANGLESLSRSVSGASLEDMVDSVRNFGRSNPAAFIGGAVLAGLALGRFARASGHRSAASFADEGREWAGDGNRSGAGRDWRDDRFGGNEGIAPEPYGGPTYPAGERAAFSPASRGSADAATPGRAQGYAGRGRPDPARPTSPSSATDASVTSPGYSGGNEPGVISTGETS